MIVDLPSSSAADVAKNLVRLRNQVGAMAMGRVLTLLVVVDEELADEAVEVASEATRQHPARILVVVSANARGRGRLDAQIRVGGDAGASEIVVLRLYGELTRHGSSVVTPLMLPDSPVVAWWPGQAPSDVAGSPLGRMAHRRITDAAAPTGAKTGTQLRRRTKHYQPGDTDLTWTRITRWRALLAASLESEPFESVQRAVVAGEPDCPSCDLLAGWLASSLRCPVERVRTPVGSGVQSVRLERASGPVDLVRLDDSGGTATLSMVGSQPRLVALHTPTLPAALTAELRRLDADEVYARSLCSGLPQVRRGGTASGAARAGDLPAGPAEVDRSGSSRLGSRSLQKAPEPPSKADSNAVEEAVQEGLEQIEEDASD
ncbi:OpcA, an allosteric effector of glucose-6-phosphate dehydrogenase, actinobacterial [Serinicoccus hydrothermalis]|uniref:OpcA, an allosteric effector of glucose-6-phosphate dehydrogenase, actinobacterial n=1 Tax=Serinicoccus hydrothermalis TaxID=1758689 RepID=A0A1B1N899_9MICO|nr:glucose-6-phosphate dehydrogenase assembly protein OpcA [Serinicoccus hydrothermalis]ANS77649.1 OpcA, an allosteric effector of glucose-6-phosphate dehydrogenase, actinobacterial [Serinicoccus hydrothermalis]